VIVRTANINFKKCPVCPLRFDTLKISSKKKQKLANKGAPQGVPFVFWGELRSEGEPGVGMTKKKAKGKIATKPTEKKKGDAKGEKELDPAEVRKDISQMVKVDARNMTEAVIDEGLKGQLATVKFLLEMAGVYPPATEMTEPTENEESLAKTLLRRLNLPEEPIQRDDDGELVTIAVVKNASGEDAAETKNADAGENGAASEKE
jgi:hypothetical protein